VRRHQGHREQHLLFDDLCQRQLVRQPEHWLVALRNLIRIAQHDHELRRIFNGALAWLQATPALQHHHTVDTHVHGGVAVERAEPQLRVDA
jgi:hypothetical protein